MLSEIFMLCWYGNEIMMKVIKFSEFNGFASSTRFLFEYKYFQSDYLGQTLYNTNWIDCSLEFKHCMKIFLEYVKKPIIMNAGKMFRLNLRTFVTVR